MATAAPTAKSDLATYLTHATRAVREHGWVSKGQAKLSGDLATADRAARSMFDGEPTTPEDEATASAAAAYFLGLPPGNPEDFISKVRFSLASQQGVDSVNPREYGILAYVIQGYAKHLEELAAPAKPVTTHVGTVGKREEFTVTLVRTKAIDSFYGTSYLHAFTDPDGNELSWFASNPDVVPNKSYTRWFDENGTYHEELTSPGEMEVGATYRIKATVKDHKEFRGVPQTSVSRVKYVATIEEATR